MASTTFIRSLGLIPGVLADSYKVSHPFEYPDAAKMVAYGEFRAAMDRDPLDQRIVFYGIRHIIDNYIAVQWTHADIKQLDKFFETHNAGFSKFEYPRDLFVRIVEEHNGYFPVKIQALPEGSVIYPHVPVYQITASDEFARLVTYLETILTMVWYPSTVATLSRRSRTRIQRSFTETVDDSLHDMLLPSRLHDFGFRGCTSVEQSMIGGAAHLLSFEGSDTMSAAFYAQFTLNNGNPVANSIPATEHSVMTSYRTEREAILRMIEKYGDKVFACVMDSYDYANALNEVLPSIAAEKVAKGGFMVLRPDSGDPVETVMMALRAADKVFGHTVNSKGFKVLNGCGVIQGDGINYKVIDNILDAATKEGYAAQNIAFGMGGGLLQKVNRDTMSFATKLCHVLYKDGSTRDVMKFPLTDGGKISLPGEFAVYSSTSEPHIPQVYPTEAGSQGDGENLLKVVYDCGPVKGHTWDDFDSVRARLNRQWQALPPVTNVISSELDVKIKATLATHHRSK
ncbi:nicotinamide phosphoribosyltransferase [Ramicandelaber brevisporus]|nr:nicotinamide phosphoribosyltransferase [Ramicandelaber brevisporus]